MLLNKFFNDKNAPRSFEKENKSFVIYTNTELYFYPKNRGFSAQTTDLERNLVSKYHTWHIS